MMPSTGSKEDNLLARFIKDGSDASHVWQVTASRAWMIGEDHIALLDALVFILVSTIFAMHQSVNLISHSKAHRSQMDGQVRCICYQATIWRKDGTAEVKSLFDVGRDRSTLQ
jgi:hypothetical protein